MDNIDKFAEFAPLIVVILIFIWQNNVFVRPEQLEKKHREIVDDIEKRIDNKYVEINAYREFQNRIYSEITNINSGIEELKGFLMKRRKDDE